MTRLDPSTAVEALRNPGQFVLNPGEYPALTIGTDQTSVVGEQSAPPGSVVIRGGVNFQNRRTGRRLANVRVVGGPVSSVDGFDGISLDHVTVEGVAGPAFNFTGASGRAWGTGLVAKGCRARDCDIALELGQVRDATISEFWADRIRNPLAPSDPSRHAFYINDACTCGIVFVSPLVTRCPGTSFRGMGDKCIRPLLWQCGGTAACGRNTGYIEAPLLIDSGALQFNQWIPFQCIAPTVRNNQGAALVFDAQVQASNAQVISPRLESTGPHVLASAFPVDPQVASRLGRMEILNPAATQPMRVVYGQPPTGLGADQFYSIIDALTPAPLALRTPEDFCNQVLGMTLDQVFDSAARPSDGSPVTFSIEAMRQFCGAAA